MNSIEYERFVQRAVQALVDADLGPDSDVQVRHDISYPGRSGCVHQIDVYWEVTLGQRTFGVAVECKNLTDTVEIGRVRDFYGVLADTGLNGVMVTTKGYQRGARMFADYYKIDIFVMREE